MFWPANLLSAATDVHFDRRYAKAIPIFAEGISARITENCYSRTMKSLFNPTSNIEPAALIIGDAVAIAASCN